MEMPASRCIAIPVGLALASALPGCQCADGRAGDLAPLSGDPGGLVERVRGRQVSAIDVTRACADPAELLRAAKTTHTAIAGVLGGHRARTSATVEARDGDRVLETLTVEATLTYRDTGEFHAVVDNSADYGRVAIYAHGALYLAPRYGKFHRRDPETPDEPETLRNQIFAELGAHLELLVPGIAVTPAGDAEHGGRRARKVAIGLGDGVPSPETTRGEAAWRQSRRVLEAEGEIFLDDETGVPLRASVRARIAARQDQRELVMAVTLEHRIENIGEQFDIEPPPADRQVATPLRSRELEQRETLLRGIAPPSRLATPADPARSGAQSGGKQ